MPHPVYFLRNVLPHASTVLTGTHSVFSLKPTAAVLCGPAVIHLMTTSTTLTTISSSCSRTLTLRLPCSKDYLKLMYYNIAIGCRFALDIFTISQQYSRTPDHEPVPLDADLVPLL